MKKTFLKVKVNTLAAESRIIRKEERKALAAYRRHTKVNLHAALQSYQALREHRVHVVRPAARSASLAYGFLRGRLYEEMERTCKVEPFWPDVARMVLRYGGSHPFPHYPYKLIEEMQRIEEARSATIRSALRRA